MHGSDSRVDAARLSAWSMAAQDMYALGHSPIVPMPIARLLWRQGGPSRELAERLRRTGGVVE